MWKQWSVAVLSTVLVATAFGQRPARTSASEVRAAPQGAAAENEPAFPFVDGLPDVKITSKNDPTKPVAGGVRWFWREYQKNIQQTKNANFNLCLLGDSITAMWPGDMFKKYFGKYAPVNFGLGGDRAENVLFRLNHGVLKDTSPKVIVLLLGTNNQGMNTAEEVAYGVANVVRKLQTVCPESRILLLGIFPKVGTPYERTKKTNAILSQMDDGKTIRFLDPGAHMLDEDGGILPGVLSDRVHLTRKGYAIWGDAMAPLLAEMME